MSTNSFSLSPLPDGPPADSPLLTQDHSAPKPCQWSFFCYWLIINLSQWQKNGQDVKVEKFVATAIEIPGQSKGPQETTHPPVRTVTLPIICLCCEAELVCRNT